MHSDNAAPIWMGNKIINQAKMLKCYESIEEIRIFNAQTGKLLSCIQGGKNFQIKGNELYTICYVVDYKTPTTEGIPYVSYERDFDWQKGRLLAESRVYNWKTGKLLSKVRLTMPDSVEWRGGEINSVTWSSDYKTALVGFWGTIVGESKADSGGVGVLSCIEFDLKTGYASKSLPTTVNLPLKNTYFAFSRNSPDGNRINICEVGATKNIADFTHSPDYSIFDLTANGESVVLSDNAPSNSAIRRLRLMDCQTGRIARNIKIRTDGNWIREIRFSPDGSTLAVSLADKGKVFLYRLK